ncbi:MAG: class I SAM-dependent methyltransferase [Ignavibacteria bacterium]|nr:class I SAM-dependent methyltransferase [Ignavibacteria bacterium]
MSNSPFDSYAQNYDAHFENNIVKNRIRPVIYETALRYFQQGNTILELNCGTGTDAIFFAQNGINVVATDVSEEMIRVASEKVQQENLSDKIILKQCYIENISTITNEKFEGIFSNFGGINCVMNLETVAKDISELLKPNGIFIVNAMNKFCLWETLSFLARLNFSSAFRRMKRNGIRANIEGSSVLVKYYFADEFTKIFSPYFNCVEVFGLNFLSPTPNSQNFYTRFPKLSEMLLNIENERRYTYPLYNFSDHVVLVLKKR